MATLVVLMAFSTSASNISGLPEIPPPPTSPTQISSSQTIIWLEECCSAIQGLLVQAVGILGIQARGREILKLTLHLWHFMYTELLATDIMLKSSDIASDFVGDTDHRLKFFGALPHALYDYNQLTVFRPDQ